MKNICKTNFEGTYDISVGFSSNLEWMVPYPKGVSAVKQLIFIQALLKYRYVKTGRFLSICHTPTLTT